jgi:hypothetical protein
MDKVFKKWFDIDLKDSGLPVATVTRKNGQVIKGVMVHAVNWNPPPECWRM